MAFLNKDYSANTYGTGGLTYVLTLIDYIQGIGQNHYPNIAMAWLRADDSLYENEISQVTIPAADFSDTEYLKIAEVKISAEGNQALLDVGEVDDLASDYVEDVKTLLSQRTSVEVLYESGAVETLPVTWDTSDYKSSYLNIDYIFDEDKEAWVSYNEAAGETGEKYAPRLYLFNGKVSLPDRVSNPNNVSTDVTLEVYVDGKERTEEPYAYPPEGIFYGSKEIHLFCDDPYAEIYYYAASKDMYEEPVKYTGSITLELEEGTTKEQDFLVAFYSKSSDPDKAISNFVIEKYTVCPIDPDNQVAEDGTYNYSIAKTFTLSKDTAVCWRVNSTGIKFEGNSYAAEDLTPADVILFDFNVDSADTVPAKEVSLVVMSIATITPAGNYSIPIQTSTNNGETWTDETEITFKTSELVADYQENGGRTTRSSSSGCNAGIHGVMIFAAVLAVFFRKQ